MLQIILISLISLFYIPSSNGSLNDCGCAKVQETNRIVGGWFAKETQVPYQALLNIKNNGGMIFCGGTILNRRYIMTAAHCIGQHKKPYSINSVRIFVGFTNKCEHHNNLWEKGLHVEKVILHPSYDNPNHHNDIGLVKLSKALVFTKKIKPACLPTNLKKTYDRLNGFATGWGIDPKHAPCQLKATMLTIQKSGVDGACRIPNHMMCGFGGKDSGVCHGDSGGPMTVNENGVHVVVGVASTVIGSCANGVYPDIFTRVTSFMPWIRKIIKDGDCGRKKKRRNRIIVYEQNVLGF